MPVNTPVTLEATATKEDSAKQYAKAKMASACFFNAMMFAHKQRMKIKRGR